MFGSILNKLFDNSVRRNRSMILKVVLLLSASNSYAHEMWIEPVKFSVQPQDTIYAHEKVGQNFKGNEYSYLASSYKQFNITEGDTTRPIKSRLGDVPVVREVATEEGLLILSAITSGTELNYETREKFDEFIKAEGLDWVFEAHKKRGLPEKGFTEIYSRNPKALIKVGHGKGSDRALGLPLEWVVETNPYTSDEGIKAQLLWQGEAFPNAHVNVFNKPKHDSLTEEMSKTELITDEQGRVVIPRGNGGLFLINSVRMIEPSKEKAEKTGAVWESIWASVTYEIQ